MRYMTFIVCLLATNMLLADVVTMKDGRRFEGRITEQGDDSVSIDTVVTGIRVQLALSLPEVASIEHAELPPAFFEEQQKEPKTPPPPVGAPPEASPEVDEADPRIAEWRAHFQQEIDSKIARVEERIRSETARLRELRVEQKTRSGALVDRQIKLSGTRIREMRKSMVSLRGKRAKYGTMTWEELEPQVEAAKRRLKIEAETEARRKADAERLGKILDSPRKAGDITAANLLANKVVLLAEYRGNGDSYRVGGQTMVPVYYRFTFMTQGGLVRVNDGGVTVSRLGNGQWHPWQFNVDGVRRPGNAGEGLMKGVVGGLDTQLKLLPAKVQVDPKDRGQPLVRHLERHVENYPVGPGGYLTEEHQLISVDEQKRRRQRDPK